MNVCGAMMNAQEASVSNQQMGVSVCTACLMQEQQRINQERDDSMMYRSEPVNKNLNRWFKEKWVDVSRTGKDGKHPPCGRSKAKKVKQRLSEVPTKCEGIKQDT